MEPQKSGSKKDFFVINLSQALILFFHKLLVKSKYLIALDLPTLIGVFASAYIAFIRLRNYHLIHVEDSVISLKLKLLPKGLVKMGDSLVCLRIQTQ